MLGHVEQAKQKWGGAHTAIDSWLHNRQKLLVQYCELAGLPPFEARHGALPDSQSIRSFCELLVDYVSTGHFEVFDKIVMQNQQHTVSDSQAADICSMISATTEEALSFNDAFADATDDDPLQDFDAKLSLLGQSLEERFELEDRLISTLHDDHL